ncbi:MAG: type II toxin-antitoxin system antitoxin SocA domain-containing protein [Halococcoides sp.]
MVLDSLREASKEEKLLYLISSTSTNGVLKGRKKLTKLAFFAEYWLPNEEMLNPNEQFGGFNFIIYKFGPFSKDLFREFDELKDDGLVEETRRPRGNSIIELTKKGETQAEKIKSKLDREERCQIEAVSEEFGDKSGHVLEEKSLNCLGIEKSEKDDYMGMPVSVIISEDS